MQGKHCRGIRPAEVPRKQCKRDSEGDTCQERAVSSKVQHPLRGMDMPAESNPYTCLRIGPNPCRKHQVRNPVACKDRTVVYVAKPSEPLILAFGVHTR